MGCHFLLQGGSKWARLKKVTIDVIFPHYCLSNNCFSGNWIKIVIADSLVVPFSTFIYLNSYLTCTWSSGIFVMIILFYRWVVSNLPKVMQLGSSSGLGFGSKQPDSRDHGLCMFSHVPLFVTLGLKPTRLLCSWDSPGKNTGVDWIALSFCRGSSRPRGGTRVSCNSCLGRQILLSLSHVESPETVLC